MTTCELSGDLRHSRGLVPRQCLYTCQWLRSLRAIRFSAPVTLTKQTRNIQASYRLYESRECCYKKGAPRRKRPIAAIIVSSEFQQVVAMATSISIGIVLTVTFAFFLSTYLWSYTTRRLLRHYNETGASGIDHDSHAILRLLRRFIRSAWSKQVGRLQPQRLVLREMRGLKGVHEVADILRTLVRTDGAGTWPPAADHNHASWPKALRPYGEIYRQIAHLLPQASPSLDDDFNKARIAEFRKMFDHLLEERIDLVKVGEVRTCAVCENRANGFTSSSKPRMMIAGSGFQAKCTTLSTVVSQSVAMHIVGAVYP